MKVKARVKINKDATWIRRSFKVDAVQLKNMPKVDLTEYCNMAFEQKYGFRPHDLILIGNG